VSKRVRSQSGVLVVTLFTSPYPRIGEGNKVQRFSCRHNCYYCPNEPGLPRSYLSEEPGVARGKRHGWDPVDQFNARAFTHYVNGHPIDKVRGAGSRQCAR
jgi:histone acetyltransferase (RNA polymerase elongator complex component)